MVRHVGFPPIYMPFGRGTPAQQKLRELEEKRRKIVEVGVRVVAARDKANDAALTQIGGALQRCVEDLHTMLDSVDRDIEALRHQTH